MHSEFIGLAAAFVVAAVFGPSIINLLTRLKAQQTISEDAPERHRKKQGTPTMGGLIIIAGALIGLGVAGVLGAKMPSVLWPVLVMTLLSAGLGFLDDFLIAKRGKNLGLKARQKLLGQFVIAIGFVAWMRAIMGVSITEVWFPWGTIDLGAIYYPLIVLMIVSMSNAVNLTDGLDGLAAGLSVIVLISMYLFPRTNGAVSVFAWSLAGGCLGFLWYNCNPAQVFMGDTGSLALGGAIAGIAVAVKSEFVVLLLGLIFVIEALSVTMQVISFKTTGKRIFKMTPIHHHFELSGWAEQKIVIRFWAVQGLIVLTLALFFGR